jgi:hypothetical protein
MLHVEFLQDTVFFVAPCAGILLHAEAVVAPIVWIKGKTGRPLGNFEHHFGVAYQVTEFLSVVSDGETGKSSRTWLRHCLDDEQWMRGVLYSKVKFFAVRSRQF